MLDIRIASFLAGTALLVSACGSSDTSPHGSSDTTPAVDAGVAPGVDAGVAPGVDAGVTPGVDAGSEPGLDAGSDGPLYFIAIHNEPWHKPDGKTDIAAEYEILRQMVKKADEVNVKLTLMFSAQWADYIVESTARVDEVKSWKAAGHELAGHHHSVYHGNWDGYTDYSEAEAIEHRLKAVSVPEVYLGTLEDYVSHLSLLDPNIVSGCMNDEPDMRALPQTIRFDTCLGYRNRGDDWAAEEDMATAEKGINEFVAVGEWAGVQRAWLTHYQITKPERTAAAEGVLESMHAGAYGVVLHSAAFEAPELYDFLTFLAQWDPGGGRSRTVRSIVESGVLPERVVPAELLETKLTPGVEELCGDGVCDATEQANPSLCPADCSQVGPCGDGVCDAAEQANPSLCPSDCP